jgi:hypothetical protein
VIEHPNVAQAAEAGTLFGNVRDHLAVGEHVVILIAQAPYAREALKWPVGRSDWRVGAVARLRWPVFNELHFQLGAPRSRAHA